MPKANIGKQWRAETRVVTACHSLKTFTFCSTSAFNQDKNNLISEQLKSEIDKELQFPADKLLLKSQYNFRSKYAWNLEQILFR